MNPPYLSAVFFLALVSSVASQMNLCHDSPRCPYPPGGDCRARNGCLFCACRTAPQVQCAQPVCPNRCYYGKEMGKDQNGCNSCKCSPRPRCPRRPECAKLIKCPYGFLKVNGCTSPTCQCNSVTCPPLTCPTGSCPEGFAKDTSGPGCPTCQCKRGRSSVACRSLQCLQHHSCPVGHTNVKVRGCPVCHCEPRRVCPQLTCALHCPFGKVIQNDCPICQCRPRPGNCPQQNCLRQNCRWGFVSDAAGCPTCQCLGGTRGAASQTGNMISSLLNEGNLMAGLEGGNPMAGLEAGNPMAGLMEGLEAGNAMAAFAVGGIQPSGPVRGNPVGRPDWGNPVWGPVQGNPVVGHGASDPMADAVMAYMLLEGFELP